MGKKVILDTNILVSAFGWDGKPRRLLQSVIDGEIELIMSRLQLRELARVLQYPRLHFTEKQRERTLNIICSLATFIEISGTVQVIEEDPDDNMFLEAAEREKATIVTGDKHLLKLKSFKGNRICTVDEYLRKK